MINTGQDIVFLKDGEALSDGVHEAIETVCNVIKEHNNFNGDPESIKSTKRTVTFVRFFNRDFRDENPILLKNDIIKLYELVGYSISNLPSNKEIKELCLCADKPNSKRYSVTKAYFQGIKIGLQLVFTRLWREKFLLLPFSFMVPKAEYIFEERFKSLFSTPVLWCVKLQHSRLNSALKSRPLNEMKMGDCKVSYWYRLILASSWYEPEDISIEELFEFRENNLNKGIRFTKSHLRINHLVPVFVDFFGNKLSFTSEEFAVRTIDFYESKSSRNNANLARKSIGQAPKHAVDKRAKMSSEQRTAFDGRKLLEGMAAIYDKFDTIDLAEIVQASTELTIIYLGNKKSIFEVVYPDVLPKKYHRAAEYWLKVEKLYSDKKNYESPKSLLNNLGLFHAYLFIYLPWWYSKNANQDDLPAYPDTLSKLNCEIFINSWLEVGGVRPLDYIRFIDLISKQKAWSNNSHYGMLHPFLMFLRWCDRKKSRLPEASEFENLLGTDDLPAYSKYSQSQKTPLARRMFKMFVRFSFALESFQSQIESKVEADELNPVLLGGHCNFINFVEESPKFIKQRYLTQRAVQPVNFCLSDYGIDRPKVSFEDDGGAEYPINSIYRFFYHNDYMVEGNNKTLVYPGDLRACLLAMETGIRGNHIRWLDLDTFDMRVNLKMLDDYLHPLTVNTDKVKTSPWVSTVSSSVIANCLQQKEWRRKISNPAFNQPVFYNGNKNSKFGAFRPLFSNSPTAGTPTSGMDRCFLALLMSFNQFLIDNGFDEESMYRIRPTGHKYYGEINPELIKIDTTKEGLEYTKIIYAKRTTVHACRNSVVGEKTRYLPESIVGKHITGQHERLVTYYNLRDPEDHYADQNRQWSNKSSEVNVNIPISDELFDREMPSNRFGTTMQKGITKNPDEAIKAYGLISIHMITDDDGNPEDGLSMIKAKKHIKLACNPTHFCPFDNVCPRDIVEELGEMKPCSLCPYAISGINHLPAISAAKDAHFEEFVDAKETLTMLRKDNPKELEMISEAEDRCNQLLMYANGWQYRENELALKLDGIKKGFDVGEFTVGKPEFIANMLEQTVFKQDGNEGSYLLKRLRDSKAFPLLDSKHIRAKFEMARRKLMAVKDPSSALNFDVSMNPMKELYSLIQSYKELHGISDKQITQVLNMTPNHLMERLEQGLGLEFKGEV
jgi:hypothetical protein